MIAPVLAPSEPDAAAHQREPEHFRRARAACVVAFHRVAADRAVNGDNVRGVAGVSQLAKSGALQCPAR